MKSIFKITLAISLMIGSFAQADYECQSFDQQNTLVIIDRPQDHFHQVEIKLGPSGPAPLYGRVTSSEGGIFKKKVIASVTRVPFLLTIVKQPKFCGRGSCDNEMGTTITAELELFEKILLFNCNETTI